MEMNMSKGQRGNKEAKKQKKAVAPVKATAPGSSTPVQTNEAPSWPKK
jgi:hypothetical protein